MKGPPFHIRAKPEEIAAKVIVAGDPARVNQLATLLERAKIVNENRGFITYTGNYKGEEITIATHGIGAPSATIVLEELIMLGARVVIRLGTCGALVRELRKGDLIVASGAAYLGGGSAVSAYLPGACMPTAPHPEVTTALINVCKRYGVKYALGPVVSSDAFYAEDPDFVRKWSKIGIIAVEMECAALFALGWMRRVKTGALLIVSDSLVREEEKELATAEELKEVIRRAGELALEALKEVKI
ncbi:MAG: 5'-methylthioadenosine phosphorylase [Thermofilum sp. ex4484_15]|nr:MAG: 5'-methylthioadenosine phosphorylase [Thermofilum sp. ex4484_15]